MQPKKSLGQHFLTSQKAIAEIIKAGDLNPNDVILEIGPGTGVLTEKLLASGAQIIAIEKDGELVNLLKEKFAKEIKDEKLILLHQDILDFNPETDLVFPARSGSASSGKKNISNNKIKINNILKYKIIANIPYYLTGMIFTKFLETKFKPDMMVLLVQKEIADRIVAKNKKESILSLAVKFYTNQNPKLIYKVSAGSFFPKPKVDSAVLQIKIKNPENSVDNVDNKDEKIKREIEKKYLEIIKIAFAHKRKMMLSNLKTGFNKNLQEKIINEKEKLKDNLKIPDWDKIFSELNLNKKVRAEDLQKENFLKIAEKIVLQ